MGAQLYHWTRRKAPNTMTSARVLVSDARKRLPDSFEFKVMCEKLGVQPRMVHRPVIQAYAGGAFDDLIYSISSAELQTLMGQP